MFRSKEEKLQLLDKAIQVHDGNAITAVSVGKKNNDKYMQVTETLS